MHLAERAKPALSPTLTAAPPCPPRRGLGANKEALDYYAGGELVNGRWAMIAVVGILAADLAGKGEW